MKTSVKAQLLDELHKLVQISATSNNTPSESSITADSSPPQVQMVNEEEAEHLWSSIFESFAQAADKENKVKKDGTKEDVCCC